MPDSKPLSVRLDPLGEGATARGSSSFAFELPAEGGKGFAFPLPIYSRVIHDGLLSTGLAEVLANACSEHRILWLDSNNPRSIDSAGRVAAIEIDTPVDIESLEHAAAVQLQFYGIPFHKNSANRYSRWKPAMPIEVRAIEELAHKVDAIRACCKPGTPVGAAIIASEATIYEDVRFMVDSGIDWIEIVQSPFYDLLPDACLTFDDVNRCVVKGVKARNDAKRICPLWLTTSSTLTTDCLRWFEQGIQAISIDPYLAKQRPVHNAPRDTLAGIRVQTANPQAAHLWIHDSIKEIADQIADLVLFRN
jgi:hypothetical protein